MSRLDRRAVLRHWRWPAGIAAALAAYAAFGFLLVPYVLQRDAPRRLEEALGRKVVIERIRTNPFTLSMTVDGFSLLDTDGRTPALSWRSLYVNYELWPIVKRELRFQAIRLEQPFLRGGIRRDGTESFADVIERIRRREAAEAARAPPGESKPWIIAVDRLDIDAASMQFRDVSHAAPFESAIGPVTLHAESFRTTADGRSPYTFTGRTAAGEAFSWTGTLRVLPLRSSGTLVIDDVNLPKYAPYYSGFLRADLRQGRASVRVTYELNLGTARVVRLNEGELHVRELALHDREGGGRILSVPELDVVGIRLDAMASTSRIDRIEARGGVLDVRRDGEGALNLARVTAPPRPETKEAPRPEAKEAPRTAAEEAPPSKPFEYEIGTVALRGWRVNVADQLPPRPVELAVTALDATIERLRSKRGAESPLTASLTWPGGGALRVSGTVAPTGPAANLTIEAEALALAPIEPYLALYGGVRARVTEGSARGKLRASVDLSTPEATAYAVSGDAAIDGLVLFDAQGEEVVRWRTLEASAIDVRSSPASAQLSVLRLVEPRLRIVERPDHTTNLASLEAPPETSSASGARTGGPKPKAASPGEQGGEGQPMAYRIGTIAVERGRITVTDRSLTPPAVLRYTNFRAKLTNFSSDAKARTGVDVEALVEGTAPFRIAGTLNPRLVGDVTDLAVRSKGIDLTPFGPYSQRYVGYALERGKLDLDMRYRVKQRKLKAENVVRVDQLSLGEKTDSPDAPKFPMGLALAVLTDRSGVMLLDVPIEGNLDDPEFKLGRVIWHAVLNVLEKVAVAPFTALAGLVGGGKDTKLDVIDFAPGSSQLDEASRGKLDQIAKALQDRPALKVEVQGVVDESSDRTALGREAVRTLATREKWQRSHPKKGEAPPTSPAITDEEYPRYLKLAYESALRSKPAQVVGAGETRGGPPPSGAPAATAAEGAPAAAKRTQGPPTPEDMEALLLSRVDLGAELRNLSSQRAAAVREQLIAREIDQSRLFLAEGGGGEKKEAAAPSARLKLK